MVWVHFLACAAFADPVRYFPDPLNKFPVRSRKFPVPLRREFAAKLMKRLRKLGLEIQVLAKTAKIPCIFPVNREIHAETGSQRTARTTTQSAGLASLLSTLREAAVFCSFRGFLLSNV